MGVNTNPPKMQAKPGNRDGHIASLPHVCILLVFLSVRPRRPFPSIAFPSAAGRRLAWHDDPVR